MSRRWAFLPRKGGEGYGSHQGFRSPDVEEVDAPLRPPSPAVAATASTTASEGGKEEEEENEGDRWSKLLPELLTEIIKRVEASEDRWPFRRSVVVCACVCRRWREVTTSIVGSPQDSGKITFPSSLKQPGWRDAPIQCLIKRNKKTSTFYLHLGIAHSFLDIGKFLMAAQRYKTAAHAEYILCIDTDDLSQRSNAYMGKLRSDFLGTRFTIYDRQPLLYGEKSLNNCSVRRFTSKQISPQVSSVGNFKAGQVVYKFNLLKSRGPRRMICTLQLPPLTYIKIPSEPLVLKNKPPRWHEHLQCWCLNFHGRVTVASVKNFQLVSVEDEETVLLQFGKVGNDMFTMDYRYPLSAFQAFVICLTSFGTKIACE